MQLRGFLPNNMDSYEAARPQFLCSSRTCNGTTLQKMPCQKIAAITRTSTRTHSDGASIPRQKAQIKRAAQDMKKTVSATLVLKSVPGSVPFFERPGVEELVKECKRRGVTQIMVPDEKRLARRLLVQEEAVKACEKVGISLVHSLIPGLFTNKDPTTQYVKHMLGAASEFETNTAVANMKNGRDVTRQKSKVKTLTGTKKCEGRKNVLQLHPSFVTVLGKKLKRPFTKLLTHAREQLSLRNLSGYLAKRGITSKTRKNKKTGKKLPGGKPIAPGRLKEWLQHCKTAGL